MKNLGTKFCEDYVVKIEPQKENIKVTTDSDEEFFCKYLVIGIGRKITKEKYKGASYCATCDGFFYRNKIVAVKGNNSMAVEDSIYLKNIAKKVYILTDGEKAKYNYDCEVLTDTIKELVYDNERIIGVKFEDKILDIDGLFVCENVSLNSMSSFGIITKNNHIKVDENYQTNIKNIFAVGDVVGMPYQISKAVYDGMKCGIYISKINTQNI